MRNLDLIRLDQIAQIIFDKKGMNIIALDVRGISNFTDFFIIAEGNVERHVSSIASSLIEEQKQDHHLPLYVEGIKTGDWVVVDYGHIVVHLFHPELRERYGLEELWRSGKIVDLRINTQGKHE